MYKYKKRNDDTVDAAIEYMTTLFANENKPELGIFWYDPNTDKLFGVDSIPYDSIQFFYSQSHKNNIRTSPKLHKSVWKKNYHRDNDDRFKGDYTQVPRGRVFEYENQGFKVYVGEWINIHSQAKNLILQEFNLPESNTEFIIDSHWNIGHGWSDELL